MRHRNCGPDRPARPLLWHDAKRRLPDGRWEDGWDKLDVRALREGDAVAPWETVLTIEGPYATSQMSRKRNATSPEVLTRTRYGASPPHGAGNAVELVTGRP